MEMTQLRENCARVAERARSVRIARDAIAPYAASLPLGAGAAEASILGAASQEPALPGGREAVAAFWLTLDAVNFGSGWFPTLRKRAGLSGYRTIERGLHGRALGQGLWSAGELEAIDAHQLSDVLDEDASHPLLGLFAASLGDLGAHVRGDYGGSFAAVADGAGGSAVTLALTLGSWRCFADASRYDELELAFLKRAQIAAADLARAGVATFSDLRGLTMFADNLVPHVLRLDGVLRFTPVLEARIAAGEVIEHGSPDEVEIRACALHAVELIVAARGGDTCAADVDQLLWNRGQEPRYKASPRHRARCTAY
jgi:hypothetical protein